MEVLLIRISLGLQMLSLPLLTPQVIGEPRMDAIRERLKALVKPTAKVASIALAATFVLTTLLLGIPASYATANHKSLTTTSFHSYPGWAQEMVKIVIWGAVVVGGGGIAITLALGLAAGLLHVATKNPQASFLLGGCVFALAVGLQLWATFYPAH
jgi:ABC-type spermidine/putrescine transport system permease subunit I